MISKILKDLVESHQESEWINKRKSLNFYEAREELLSQGKVYFYESGSSILKYVTNKEDGNYMPNPILADVSGVFEIINGNGDYKVVIADKSDLHLLHCDPVVG